MGVSSLPKTVTRQRCGCDLNPGTFVNLIINKNGDDYDDVTAAC